MPRPIRITEVRISRAEKEFLNTLKSNIDKYEEQSGKIKKPEAILKAEKELKKPVEVMYQ